MGRAPTLGAIAAAFFAGIFSHLLYQRWNPSSFSDAPALSHDLKLLSTEPLVNQSHLVRFIPLAQSPSIVPRELPVLVARDIDKIRALAGQEARVRGRVFRVGHSAKSNTYFLNFGPSREALSAVIFTSAVERFEKSQRPPKSFENKDVELVGQIKDHPQYGLELVLEDPNQIKILP